LREPLRGSVTKRHRFLLRLHLNQSDSLAAAIASIDAQVAADVEPFRGAVEQLISIPGINDVGT
jgi:transposase